MLLAGERENAVDAGFFARFGEDRHFGSVDGGGQIGPFGRVEALRRIFREDDQIEARIAALHAFDETSDALAIIKHLLPGFDHRNLIIDNSDANRVRTG